VGDQGKDRLLVRDAARGEEAAIRELTIRVYAEYAEIMAPDAWAGLNRAVRRALETREPVERIVAVLETDLVGSVQLWPPAADVYGGHLDGMPWPELRLLAVSPEERGSGVGRSLVEECVVRARRTGASDLGLHTSRSMRAAIRLYESMGFERAPEFDFQPSGAELVTAYRLSLR
jgi:ribosomal protein S18 acetylase RimI-like enzyme